MNAVLLCTIVGALISSTPTFTAGTVQCPLIGRGYSTALERSIYTCDEDTPIGRLNAARVYTKEGMLSECLPLCRRVVTNPVLCSDEQPGVKFPCDMKSFITVVLLSSCEDIQQSQNWKKTLAISGALMLVFAFVIVSILARGVYKKQWKHQDGNETVWQQIPDSFLLNERQLQKISELITNWKPLARYLGLKEQTISEINEDNSTSKERKYQMLYTWSQRKGDDATLKALLQCVVELGERDLAQRIVGTLRIKRNSIAKPTLHC